MEKVKNTYERSLKIVAFNIKSIILGILFDEDGKTIFQGEFKNNEYWNGKGNKSIFYT